MKRSQRQQAVCAVAFAVTGAVAPLHAQNSVAPRQNLPEPEATHFEFRAPPGCGSAEDFAAHVRRRSSRIRLVSDANAKRSLLVEISEPGAGGALRGTVTVVEPDGATRKRELKAAGCAEAVDALSLIATVTLDPDAMLDEPTPERQPEPKPAPRAVANEPTPRVAETAPPVPPPQAYRLSVGVAAALLVEMAPEPAFGGSASVALELKPGGLWAPFLRVSLTHAERRGLTEPAGNANFAFTLPTLDVCPVRLGSRAFGVRPCAFGTLGALEVWGSGVTNKESHSRLYGAAGAALSFGLRVSKAFEIIADGRAGLPFRRDQFGFDEVPFYRTHMLGFSAGAGVAGGFP